MTWDPVASVGRLLTILGFWLAAQTARLIASVKKADPDVRDLPFAAPVRVRQKTGSRSRSVKAVVSCLRKSVVSPSGQDSRGVPGPSVPGRVRFAPSRRMSVWSVQEGEVFLARRQCCADFTEVSLQILDPSI